jgi:predicted GH43/DUF377 family glycosyl hydrolase
MTALLEPDDVRSTSSIALRHALTMQPDDRRVIIKLFVPGEDARLSQNRTSLIIERILQLDEDEIARLLTDVTERFSARHPDILSTFQHHYDLVQHRVPPDLELPPSTRSLIGAYFTHEFSVEAAALCNPSMVPHPDQTGLESGQLRAAISLRLIGEGHISSIGFCSVVLGPGEDIRLEDREGPLTMGHRVGAKHIRALLAAGLADEDIDTEISAVVLAALPERYDDVEFEDILGHLPGELLARPTTNETLEVIRRIVANDYAVTFPPNVPLHERVLWPATPAESNGMEDARFVQVHEEGGGDRAGYLGTYTAYDGRHISGRMLYSRDLRHFEVTALHGPASRNKGMALFPRGVNGRYLALCRPDGETLRLCHLDENNRWQEDEPLLVPRRGWDLIQVGNCGSPVETKAGWLVLTHGVGPLRRYVIGAMLLDLEHPERVIADLPQGLLSPDEIEREGYVPNVVYSCGGMIHDGRFWMPYGASDVRIGFASIGVDELLEAMVPVH